MKFRDEYWFLSNMYPCRIQSKRTGLVFTCAEAAYQAMKCPSRASEFQGLNGFDAKKLGREVEVRHDWDVIKVSVMRKILEAKFRNIRLKLLLSRIEGEIVEDNTWGDKFWGKCHGKGQNMLGKLLMEIRDEPCKGDEGR